MEMKLESYIFNLRAFTSDKLNNVYDRHTKETDNIL